MPQSKLADLSAIDGRDPANEADDIAVEVGDVLFDLPRSAEDVVDLCDMDD